jgi:DNA/RNA endonuclease G (NUC1)
MMGYSIVLKSAETRKSLTLRTFPLNNQEIEKLAKYHFLRKLSKNIKEKPGKIQNCQNGLYYGLNLNVEEISVILRRAP